MDSPAEQVKKRGGGRPKDPVWAYFDVSDPGSNDEKATCKACGWAADKPKAFRMRDHVAACPNLDPSSRSEMAEIIAQKQDATQAKQEAKAHVAAGGTPPEPAPKKRKTETPVKKPLLGPALRSPITCHVLDATSGKPGNEMGIRLDRLTSNGFVLIANGSTDADGRCNTLLPGGSKPEVGIYKITFFSNEFYQKRGILSFYPFVEITFEVKEPGEHYHVPLLLSPYAFSTYRGS